MSYPSESARRAGLRAATGRTIEETRHEVNELNKDVANASLTFTMFLILGTRVTGLLRRLGLPENIVQAISVVTRMIFMVRMLRSALIALEMETPYGWIKGGLGLLTTAIVAGDTMMELSGG